MKARNNIKISKIYIGSENRCIVFRAIFQWRQFNWNRKVQKTVNEGRKRKKVHPPTIQLSILDLVSPPPKHSRVLRNKLLCRRERALWASPCIINLYFISTLQFCCSCDVFEFLIEEAKIIFYCEPVTTPKRQARDGTASKRRELWRSDNREHKRSHTETHTLIHHKFLSGDLKRIGGKAFRRSLKT
jgi:hypothetical protein